MRKFFIKRLDELNTDLIEIGAMCETLIENSGKALMDRDVEKAKEVIDYVSVVNANNRKIEGEALNLVLAQQPVASDFRFIQTAIKMLADLDRIANMSSDLCQLLVFMTEYDYKLNKSLKEMAKQTKNMINSAIECYIKKDLELTDKVIAQDDIIDALFNEVKEDLEKELKKNPKISPMVLDKLMLAKYFERIGDHAENIAWWVKYAITGLYKGERL